jgi:pyruvate,orthophosphate dikinase
MDGVRACIATLERQVRQGIRLGGNPLLVSVRSGSAMSMPGMMDTILNLGLNAATLRGLAERTGKWRFAWMRTGASSSSTARSRWAFPTKPSTQR